MSAPQRLSGRRALFILAVMAVFCAAEVAVALHPVPGIVTSVLLMMLAAGQLIFFLTFSMHLREETRAFKRMVSAPLVVAALYGVVLIAESVWRHRR